MRMHTFTAVAFLLGSLACDDSDMTSNANQAEDDDPKHAETAEAHGTQAADKPGDQTEPAADKPAADYGSAQLIMRCKPILSGPKRAQVGASLTYFVVCAKTSSTTALAVSFASIENG